jgi:hypothetical protein
MATDDLSAINLPPVAWTGNAGSHESRDEEKKENKVKKSPKKADNRTSAEVDFEPVEHDLDSIA